VREAKPARPRDLHGCMSTTVTPSSKTLTQQFGYKSVMQVPRIDKIVLNMGVGEAIADKKIMDNAVADMMKIAGRNRW
jgi:large subunit ribosomal protein L5